MSPQRCFWMCIVQISNGFILHSKARYRLIEIAKGSMGTRRLNKISPVYVHLLYVCTCGCIQVRPPRSILSYLISPSHRSSFASSIPDASIGPSNYIHSRPIQHILLSSHIIRSSRRQTLRIFLDDLEQTFLPYAIRS
jgi:hypothetical protein